MADGDLIRLEQTPGNPYPLGRHVNHDPRNRDYPIGEVLDNLRRGIVAGQTMGSDFPWWRTGVFDQHSESSCTAQAEAGLLITSPNRTALPRKKRQTDPPDTVDKCYQAAYRYQWYRTAQTLDPWDGDEDTPPRYEGSSGVAAAKAAKQLGLVPAGWQFRWGFSTSDAVNAHRVAPVSNGTVWLNSMFRVDKRGYLIVDPNSGEAGGHQWESLFVDVADDYLLAINSWGPGWANRGRFKIHLADYEWLLHQDGDTHIWVPG